MFNYYSFVVLALLLHSQLSEAIWSCQDESDCASLSGGICQSGLCVCPVGTQAVAGGTICADVAPYFGSTCFEDFQCQRLFTGYRCAGANETQEGTCQCQPGHHYYIGRCWPSRELGATCSRTEECMTTPRNPHSMTCDDGVCVCSEGFYLRQRGECRQIGFGIGDGCVIDGDCMFENGACDRGNLICYDITVGTTTNKTLQLDVKNKMSEYKMATRQHGRYCDGNNPCDDPFQCSVLGVCVCPLGYYPNGDATSCYAELGSPATNETCLGELTVLRDGICTCPANFFYDENAVDCVKATQRFTDSCIRDEMCHTFGAAGVCAPPTGPWGMRQCDCLPDIAVWDEALNMCRLFVGVGELCEVDSDCLAGNVEILCAADGEGLRRCTCPEGLTAVQGLCLTSGLDLGDSCQVDQECTGVANMACVSGQCGCGEGFQAVGDFCAPMLGETCQADSDCAIANSFCRNESSVLTCQCQTGYTYYVGSCLPVTPSYNGSCDVTNQCVPSLGEGSYCEEGRCICEETHHYRSGQCWPRTGLFESCSRNSMCFLGDVTERVVCRNGLCQCDFDFPYSEALDTCTSGTAAILGGTLVILSTIILTVFSH